MRHGTNRHGCPHLHHGYTGSVRNLSQAVQPLLTFERDSLLTKYLDHLVDKHGSIRHQIEELMMALSNNDKAKEATQLNIDELNSELLNIEPVVKLIILHRQTTSEISQLHDLIKGN